MDLTWDASWSRVMSLYDKGRWIWYRSQKVQQYIINETRKRFGKEVAPDQIPEELARTCFMATLGDGGVPLTTGWDSRLIQDTINSIRGEYLYRKEYLRNEQYWDESLRDPRFDGTIYPVASGFNGNGLDFLPIVSNGVRIKGTHRRPQPVIARYEFDLGEDNELYDEFGEASCLDPPCKKVPVIKDNDSDYDDDDVDE